MSNGMSQNQFKFSFNDFRVKCVRQNDSKLSLPRSIQTWLANYNSNLPYLARLYWNVKGFLIAVQ